MSVYPAEDAPQEPSANVLCWHRAHRLCNDAAALERHIDRYLRVQARADRRRKAALIMARRKIPGPPPGRPA